MKFQSAFKWLSVCILVGSQHKNIFYSSMALWDGDVRPAGFAARLDLEPIFVNAGYFQVRYVDADIAERNALQIGIEFFNCEL
ncbi:MAG: hypothetical protein U5L07_14455 [Desulfobacterales bacterium]|nr:hypothetical protein [Desulfobacterales bacterium]